VDDIKKLRTIPEAAPLVHKSEGALRWYLNQADCKLRTVRMGRRIYVTQASIDALLAGDLEEASA
jgi:hypothetical protein